MITCCKLTIFHRKDIRKKRKNMVRYFIIITFVSIINKVCTNNLKTNEYGR